jgi:outer membrane protein OmpA-like peptidoglycan-associated protein
MIKKKDFIINLLKASLLCMLAFSAIGPLSAQEMVSLSEINSPYDEQHPVVSPSGVLFYTVGFYNGGGDPGDIWRSTRENDNAYSSPSKVTELSTVGLDVVVGFLDDQNILVYHDGKGKRQGIHHYIWNAGSWNHKEQLDMGSFRNQSDHFSGRLAPSKDVIILSLASFGSYGNEDIYVSFLKEDGRWTSPQNLGPSINTFHQEMTPYLSADTHRLFFSTNGHGSTRGVDIYYSQRLDDSWENWSQPQPLSTANTTGAELAYLPLDGEVDLAIYTSTQNSEGYGDLQIIQAELPLPINLPEQTEAPVPAAPDAVADLKTTEEPEILEAPLMPVAPGLTPKPEASENEGTVEAEVVQGINENRAQEIQKAPMDSLVKTIENQVVEEEQPKAVYPLQVLDINSLEPIKYNLLIKDSQGNDVIIQAEASEERSLPEAGALAAEWVVTSPGYLPLRIKSPSPERLKEPVLMTPARKGVSMVLEDILFKRGTAELAEENSLSLIHSLAGFLRENPGLRILLEGHTDNLGNAQLNKELSLQRASAIRQWLVEQGIAFERMRIAGWGGTKPIDSNQTEEGRMKNRRVEMVIVE